MLKIKNREAIVEQLTEMLMQFDKDCNQYQTDVYLYYDAENQTAELDTFINVGANSWLNDDHYTIYCDKEHYENFWDWYQTVGEFADVLEIPDSQLAEEVRDYLEYDKFTELDWSDYNEYISANSNYTEKLQQAYNDYIDEIQPDYAEKAEEIMRRFDEECNYYEEQAKGY